MNPQCRDTGKFFKWFFLGCLKRATGDHAGSKKVLDTGLNDEENLKRQGANLMNQRGLGVATPGPSLLPVRSLANSISASCHGVLLILFIHTRCVFSLCR